MVLKAKKDKRRKDRSQKKSRQSEARKLASRLKKSQQRLEGITARIEAAEARVNEIDEMFCGPDYFQRTAADEIRAREREQDSLKGEVADLLTEWEQVEEEIAALEQQLAAD